MKKLIAITLVVLSLTLVNCKDSGEDPEPGKTLNKSLITNKYWKTTSGITVSHYFGSNGKCYLPNGTTESGTWQWLNNSDSLEKIETNFGRTVWYAEYCTETELKMRLSGNNNGYIFTKQ